MSKTPRPNKNSIHVQHTNASTNLILEAGIVDSWQSAIRKAKHKIARLKADIVIFEEMQESGEPWPGAQSKGHAQLQQHSVS